VFAGCFTCSENFSATTNISRALTSAGFGVLRFDFTGLGDSAGDFGDTNFSGNVDDLVAAIPYLSEHRPAPALLVGHSLGGAAAISASAKANSIKALATVGTPSDTKHVNHLFGDQLEAIVTNGEAIVQLSGRPFKIKQQLLRDLNEQMVTETLQSLRKPILIMHSQEYATVSITHAEKLSHAAIHPKSFVSLDGADQLLMNKADSNYAGDVIATWASRYLDLPVGQPPETTPLVVASLSHDSIFTTQMRAGNHYFIADEPVAVGVDNFGPAPYDLLSSGLAACTVMTVQRYARRKQWHFENIEWHVQYGKQHRADSANCNEETDKIDTFTRTLKITSNLDKNQLQRVLQIANKCPVHKTLHSQTQVLTTLI